MRHLRAVVLASLLLLFSTTAFAQVGAGPTPPTPANPQAQTVHATDIIWSWGQVGQATGYHVYAAAGPTPPAMANATITPKQTTTWTYANLLPNTQYCFQVDAYNANGSSAKTSTISAYTLQNPASTPTFGVTGVDSITLSTSGPVNVMAGNSGVVFNVNGNDRVKVKALGETITGLAANTRYTFKAKAVNAAGLETAYSGISSRCTLAASPVFGSGAAAINCDKGNGGTAYLNMPITFMAVNGFGAGADKARAYKYVWDMSPAEPNWSTALDWVEGSLVIRPTALGRYYMHVRSVNQDDVANTSTLALNEFNVIPEPSSFLMLGSGLLALAGIVRRKK